ncbi:MAG: Tfp pilus assembly protein FimT/FimU, partial [Dorea formicigenerans]
MNTKGKAWKLKNKGFTLIEMIVTVAIIAIFSGVVVTFIGTGSGVY